MDFTSIRNWLCKFLFLVVVYGLLACLFTYPLIKTYKTKVPNNLYIWHHYSYIWGDHLQTIAGFREQKNTINNFLHNQPVYKKENCFEEIDNCTMNSTEVVNTILFSPYWNFSIFAFFTTDIISYNLGIMSSFILTGMLSFWYAKNFLKSQNRFENDLIAFFASLFCVISLKRIHHLLVGQRGGWLIIFLILYMHSLERIIKKSKFKLIYIFLSSFCLYYLFFTERFFIYFGLIFTIFRLLGELTRISMKDVWNNFIYKYWFIWLNATIITFLGFIGDWNILNKSIIEDGRSLDVIGYHSPTIFNLVNAINLDQELNIYLGFGVLVVLFFIWMLFYKIVKKSKSREDSLLFIAFIFFFMISLGLNTFLYPILYSYLPGFKFSRTPARAFYLCIILLVAMATKVGEFIFDLLNRHIANKKHCKILKLSIMSLCIIFTIILFYPFRNISLTKLPTVPSIEPGTKVLYLPYVESGDFYNSIYEYSLSTAEIVSLNGYHPFVSKQIDLFEFEYGPKFNTGDIKSDDISYLKDNHVDKIVIFKEYFFDYRVPFLLSYPQEPDLMKLVENLRSNPMVVFDYEDDEFLVLKINEK